MKNKIPLTTNESYETVSSQALGVECEMYDYIDDSALRNNDIPLTTNASYGTTSLVEEI